MTSQPNLDPFFLLGGHFETGSKISPVWTLIAPQRKIQIKKIFFCYVYQNVKYILNMKKLHKWYIHYKFLEISCLINQSTNCKQVSCY